MSLPLSQWRAATVYGRVSSSLQHGPLLYILDTANGLNCSEGTLAVTGSVSKHISRFVQTTYP